MLESSILEAVVEEENPGKKSELENIFLEEVPKPITGDQYFEVFKKENQEDEVSKSNIPFDFILKGRSSKSKNDFIMIRVVVICY